MPHDSSQLVDYEAYWSAEARELRASALADMVNAFLGVPDTVTLHAGLPAAESFPLISLTGHLAYSSELCGSGNLVPSNGTDSTSMPPGNVHQTTTCDVKQGTGSQAAEAGQQGSAALAAPPVMEVSGQPMLDAQQYMFHSGHPPLLNWVRQLARTRHRPPNPIECAMSSGAVNALVAGVSVLCDAGDYVLCEEYAYTHASECVFLPRGLKILPVGMDENGMTPDSLRRVLASTPPSPVTGKPPRVLYVIPSGQNPTGSIMPVQRKQEIYQICREHGIIILEDDAYVWLQYPHGADVGEAGQPGLDLPPSFLTLDTDSRVLRIDTVSKLLGPGYRLGWVTGAPVLVGKVAQAIQAGTCGPSSLSQVVVSQMFESWGTAGFEAFCRKQQALYARRAAAAHQAAARHLTGLATWQEPRAGMFMWLRLIGEGADVDAGLMQHLVAQRVVIVPGRPFWTDISKARGGVPCPYFRVTFGCAPMDKLDEGMRRLAAAIIASRPPLPKPLPAAAALEAMPGDAHSTAAGGAAVKARVREDAPGHAQGRVMLKERSGVSVVSLASLAVALSEDGVGGDSSVAPSAASGGEEAPEELAAC